MIWLSFPPHPGSVLKITKLSVVKITKFPKGWKFRWPAGIPLGWVIPTTSWNSTHPRCGGGHPPTHTRRQTHSTEYGYLSRFVAHLLRHKSFSDVFVCASIPKKRESVDGAQVEGKRCLAGAPRIGCCEEQNSPLELN